MTVKLAFLLVPVIAVSAVAGCNAGAPGNPVSVPVTPSSVHPSTTLSESIDPCTLLTSSDAQAFGLVSNGRDTTGGARSCSWHKTGQYTIGTGVFDHIGLAQLSKAGRTITDHPVGIHDGRQVFSQEGGCGVYLQITSHSVTDVVVVDAQDAQQECALADDFARLVEPKLPPEQQ